MSRIFISYRREDGAGYAGRLYDRLSQRFGSDQIFMDVDTIKPGVDFVKVIKEAVGSCDVLIALIGKQWLTITDSQSQQRLNDPEDFVRLEIEAALERNVRVIPTLIGGAAMPRSQDLPDELEELTRRNAIEISDTRFHEDVDRLIKELDKVLGVPKLTIAPPLWVGGVVGILLLLSIVGGIIYLTIRNGTGTPMSIAKATAAVETGVTQTAEAIATRLATTNAKATDTAQAATATAVVATATWLEADDDRDGLSNGQELDLDTLPDKRDTDEDGLDDGEEVNSRGTDPLKTDTDGDGLKDGDEISRGIDPMKPDTDGDGISDASDPVPDKLPTNMPTYIPTTRPSATSPPKDTTAPVPPMDTSEPTPISTPRRELLETTGADCSAQQFEYGFFHGGHGDYIYSIFDDGTWVRHNVKWEEGKDPRYPACTDDERLQYGFGKNYCQHPEIATKLGNPYDEGDTVPCTIEVYSDGVRLPAQNYGIIIWVRYGNSQNEGTWSPVE